MSTPVWECGCGCTNGVNLAECAVCRRPRYEGESRPRPAEQAESQLAVAQKTIDVLKDEAVQARGVIDGLESQLAALTRKRDDEVVTSGSQGVPTTSGMMPLPGVTTMSETSALLRGLADIADGKVRPLSDIDAQRSVVPSQGAQLAALRDALRETSEFIDELDDRSLEDLKEGRLVGGYVGDIYNAPDDCETCIIITRGELRKARKQLSALLSGEGEEIRRTNDDGETRQSSSEKAASMGISAIPTGKAPCEMDLFADIRDRLTTWKYLAPGTFDYAKFTGAEMFEVMTELDLVSVAAAEWRENLAAMTVKRDTYRTLARVGEWHDECRPNRHMAARELQKSQAVIEGQDLREKTTAEKAPSAAKTYTEYRVISCRAGGIRTDKRYRSLKQVRDRIGRLTSLEPWRFYGSDYDRLKNADDLVCCKGTVYDECACGGLTMAQQTAELRKDLPPVEWVRVEVRQVTRQPWQPYAVPTVDEAGSSDARPTDSAEGKATGSASRSS